jgi:hypothetical protein
MSDVDKNLSAILETEFIPHEEAPRSLPVASTETSPADAQEDFDYSRRNYQDLLEKGGLALDGILEVARESQHPRAYEVAATMMKNLADMTDKLMILQKQRKELEGGNKTGPTNVTVDKAVFVGSTADLLKKIHGNNREN